MEGYDDKGALRYGCFLTAENVYECPGWEGFCTENVYDSPGQEVLLHWEHLWKSRLGRVEAKQQRFKIRWGETTQKERRQNYISQGEERQDVRVSEIS